MPKVRKSLVRSRSANLPGLHWSIKGGKGMSNIIKASDVKDNHGAVENNQFNSNANYSPCQDKEGV